MKKIETGVIVWAVLSVCLSACAGSTIPESPQMPTPTSDETTTSPTTSRPQVPVSALEPQPIQFQSADGIQLAGTYWPPAQSPAPGILLMHMMGKTKESWEILPALLQGIGMVHDGTQPSYAVLAFDFRGHGESSGDAADRQKMLEDAQAALAYFQSLPGVDPQRIVMIGASVGADAAVDICGQGCIGAISLSPGSFLGPNYNDALAAVKDKPVLCVASENDSHSLETCREGEQVGMSTYQMQLYQGDAHGTDMFAITDQQPMLTDLIFEWLTAHVLGG
ncbi:MAG: alpha/beta fold hydrolase [Anaerolineae bacterium]|nr:alpha/beta fold hydrolase [Anaerolineae bacterium]